MNKFYSLAFVLTTTSVLVCCGPCPSPTGSGGADGGAGGTGGATAPVCDCSMAPTSPVCEALCGGRCESLCGECAETEGEGRKAFVCNNEPGGITISFYHEGQIHLCDGFTADHCQPGTDCVAFSHSGMLVGKCQ